MRTSLALLIGAVSFGALARTASAQEAIVSQVVGENSFDADGVATYEGHGYELSKGLFAHGAVGLEGGFSDNVFNEANAESPKGSGLMRLAASVYVSSDHPRPEDAAAGEDNPSVSTGNFEFRGGLRAAYEEFLSGNDTVRANRNLNLNALGNFVVNPQGGVAFVVGEVFTRDMRSANFEDSSLINRDDNRLALGIRFQPTGRNISLTIGYENWTEIFEDSVESAFVDRMNHTLSAKGEWQALPFTKLLAEFSYGFFGPLGDSKLAGMTYKSPSQPLRATVGLSTLLTESVTLKAHAGYAQASYDVGEGYAAPVGGAEVGYRWSPLGRIAAIYDYDHFDSFNANFYSDHLFALKAVQQLGPVVIDASPEIRLRHFGGIPMQLGPPERDDFVMDIRARAQLLFAERYSVFATYELAEVHTTYRATGVAANGNDNPSFLRNEVFLGLRVAY